MTTPPPHPRDPIGWHLLVTALFAALVAVRLTVPSEQFFDEIHYVPAAQALLDLSRLANPEHPPLGKELIALGMWMFGDNALGWRIMPAVFGVLALFAGMRGMWFASNSRGASVLTGVFLATAFPLFIQSRIAMLDVFMASFLLLALWMCAAALRENEHARWRLAAAGVALGAAMASKWNAAPLAMLPGIAFFIIRWRDAGSAVFYARRGAPVGGMALSEAFVWLGLVPLAVYALTYWPYPLLARDAVPWTGLIAQQSEMLDLQTEVLGPHPYQSTWGDWVLNIRAIWYLYEFADGAQRGVLYLGNPLTSLAGLPAMAWCAWAGIMGRRRDALAVFILYAVSIGMWIALPKSVQFYYHYFVPSCFLMAGLALACEALWNKGERLIPAGMVAGALALFAFFFPILTAAPLDGDQAFLRWAWVESWR